MDYPHWHLCFLFRIIFPINFSVFAKKQKLKRLGTNQTVISLFVNEKPPVLSLYTQARRLF